MPGFWRSQRVAKSVISIWRGSMTISLAPFWRTAFFRNRLITGWVSVVLLPVTMKRVQVFHLGDAVAHRARADRQLQAGDAAGVAQPGAVIDVVGASSRPDPLLKDVVVFVGGFGAYVGGCCPGPCATADQRVRAATRSSASSQLASPQSSGPSAAVRCPGCCSVRRISGAVSRLGWCT